MDKEEILFNNQAVKIFILILINIFFVCEPCLAEIITTNELNVIENHVKSATENTLVVFDIDDVLLQPKDFCLKNYHDSKEQKKAKCFFKKIHDQLNIEQQSEMIVQAQLDLIDPNMVQLIHSLQKRKIKVLALTARITGKFGKITHMENLTIKELQRFGYHFKSSWNNLNDQIFYEITPKIPKKFPIFKQGVLLTNGISKGKVLAKFLDYVTLRPQKLIFIDDHKKNLESVADFANKENLIFLGIEYTIARDSNKQLFNEELANFQLDMLKKTNKWLSDQQANRILRNIK